MLARTLPRGSTLRPRPRYQRSLAILEKVRGPDYPDVAPALSNCAALLQATKRSAEAAKLEARASAIREKTCRWPIRPPFAAREDVTRPLSAPGDESIDEPSD